MNRRRFGQGDNLFDPGLQFGVGVIRWELNGAFDKCHDSVISTRLQSMQIKTTGLTKR
jgi:hypothetical protein